MIKKLSVILLCALLLPASLTFAQDEASETIAEGEGSDFFTVEVEPGTQSPWTKSVPVTVKFRAEIDSERTEISWDPPTGVRIKERHPQFVAVEEGNVYEYSATVIPDTAGTYNIAVNVTAWQIDTNYTSSASVTLKFGEELITVPETVGYSSAVLLRNVSIALLSVMGIVGAAYLGKFGLKQLKEWLKPPE